MQKLNRWVVIVLLYSAVCLVPARFVWADIKVPVTISYSTSTAIVDTMIGVGDTGHSTVCAGSPCMSGNNDPLYCNAAGAFGNNYTEWASSGGQFSLATHPSGSTIYLDVGLSGSTGNLAHMLCPNGTTTCHVCICSGGNLNTTATDVGICNSSSGTAVATSCFGTGIPASVTSNLTLSCP